jgi:AraC family transcriptional regulator, regulatory protein of adaptative response / methylated-DNA-[protein]-cysteine methyltransferase
MATSDYARIEKAIRYLDANFRAQPSLSEIAAQVHLSEYHFQRLFRRWAGITPKRFLQYLTAEHSRRLLRESRSVLEVSDASGLSSAGRLHDLLVGLHAVTPGELKTQGADLVIRYGFHPSPFGECLIAITPRGVCALEFVGEGGRAAAFDRLLSQWQGATLRHQPRATRLLAARVFAAPHAAANCCDLFVQGSNFQVKVWEALLRIPPGHVVSYEDIAARIGAPAATRAVASAIARNSIAFLIPCHRVIRKTGVFGEYRWGSTRKQAILGWEAAQRESDDSARSRENGQP